MLIRIVAFPGSSRPDSLSQKLFDCGVARALEAGAEVKSVYMQDVDSPICVDDCEVEDEIHLYGRNIREKMASHHILLIATPECSGGRPRARKKLPDWMDRLIGGALSGVNRMVSGLTALLFALASCLSAMGSQIGNASRAHKSQPKGTVSRHCE